MKTEFIWSDGHRSKFKNKYMVHLLQSLSAKHNMKIENIEFTATSHGKSVVHGTGGNVEPLVLCHSMNKSKNKIVVQDAQSFAVVAKQLNVNKCSFDHKSRK